MKKFLFVLVVMGLAFSAGPVFAKDGFYLGMDLGVAVARKWTCRPEGWMIGHRLMCQRPDVT